VIKLSRRPSTPESASYRENNKTGRRHWKPEGVWGWIVIPLSAKTGSDIWKCIFKDYKHDCEQGAISVSRGSDIKLSTGFKATGEL